MYISNDIDLELEIITSMTSSPSPVVKPAAAPLATMEILTVVNEVSSLRQAAIDIPSSSNFDDSTES
ncbi:uncharacterized protein A4U43_C03F27720 [Asparagus officinalis]|uniref:Uncharacterized protein n=1 Tax=Asparagus officinalis TaxID=4686 RepID=A0A5P1FHR2_ASPOF|nr:uncharacterized protein A4U43_C03F27720 [Asparagus officinalis]